jgi:hypothetical protein
MWLDVVLIAHGMEGLLEGQRMGGFVGGVVFEVGYLVETGSFGGRAEGGGAAAQNLIPSVPPHLTLPECVKTF